MLFLALLSIKLIAAVNVKERNEIKYIFANNKIGFATDVKPIENQRSTER